MIWKLTRKDINTALRNPSENMSAVVRAATEADARWLANTFQGDEGSIWTDPGRVDCVAIDPAGFPPMVLLIGHKM